MSQRLRLLIEDQGFSALSFDARINLLGMTWIVVGAIGAGALSLLAYNGAVVVANVTVIFVVEIECKTVEAVQLESFVLVLPLSAKAPWLR